MGQQVPIFMFKSYVLGWIEPRYSVYYSNNWLILKLNDLKMSFYRTNVSKRKCLFGRQQNNDVMIGKSYCHEYIRFTDVGWSSWKITFRWKNALSLIEGRPKSPPLRCNGRHGVHGRHNRTDTSIQSNR